MMTTPSLLFHHRRTMPHPCKEASHVTTAMWAAPVSFEMKDACSVLETKGHSGRPLVANSSMTPRMNKAASLTAGGMETTRSEIGSSSVSNTEENRATKGCTYGRHAE